MFTPSQIKWRDWDWSVSDDPLAPLALNTPGQIVYCPVDLFSPVLAVSTAQEKAERLRILQRNTLFSVARLCPRQRFVVWTKLANPAVDYYRSVDLPSPKIQAEAAQFMLQCVGRPDSLLPFDPQSGQRMTARECFAWSKRFGDKRAVAYKNEIPGNVWLGLRLHGRNRESHRNELAKFAAIPAAVKWLFLGNGVECDFASHVWGDEFVAVDDATQGDVIETQAALTRRIDWVVCGGINTAAIEYHLAQCIETGTPAFVEAAKSLPHTCSVRQFPVAAEREPLE